MCTWVAMEFWLPVWNISFNVICTIVHIIIVHGKANYRTIGPRLRRLHAYQLRHTVLKLVYIQIAYKILLYYIPASFNLVT